MKRQIQEIDRELEDSGVIVSCLSSVFYLNTTLSADVVSHLVDLTDEILSSENSNDYSRYLAGEIQEGNQIEISKSMLRDNRFLELTEIIETLSLSFVERYFSSTRMSSSPSFSCEINDMWIVSQLAGDFNPPHRHLIKSDAGLSGVLYLKIPDQIGEERKDGCFQFIWGPDSRYDISRFSLSNIETISPTAGLLILFPHSLTHQAFPFRGDGERRCVPFNVNVWPDQGASWKI